LGKRISPNVNANKEIRLQGFLGSLYTSYGPLHPAAYINVEYLPTVKCCHLRFGETDAIMSLGPLIYQPGMGVEHSNILYLAKRAGARYRIVHITFPRKTAQVEL
jgi:hypothetical protein